MKNKQDRLDILDQLEKGEITPQQAAEALERDPEQIFAELDSPMKVLEAVESGKITADEAAEQLGKEARPELIDEDEFNRVVHQANAGSKHPHFEATLGSPPPTTAPPLPPRPHQEEGHPDDLNVRNDIWTGFIAAGTIIIALSTLWMTNRVTSGAGIDFWFFFAWLPFALGLLLLVTGWQSKVNPFIKIDVRSKSKSEKYRIQVGLALPKRFIAWGLHQYSKGKHGLSFDGMDDILDKMQNGLSDEPILIHVDDEDEDIEIVIG